MGRYEGRGPVQGDVCVLSGRGELPGRVCDVWGQ
jgi:hypothetical protein